MQMENVFTRLGIKDVNKGASTGTEWMETSGKENISVSPINNRRIASVKSASFDDYEIILEKAQEAFLVWRELPAPKRGEVVRQIGNALREHKEELGYLVSWEMGKILQEGLGEVQEMIDICDFAVGQSRLLNGFTMHSERRQHRMYDQYQPLGIVGLITSFNFPVAVWAWNAMVAAVCGDVVIWKPSSQTPLTAIAVHKIIAPVLKRNDVPEGVFNLMIAGSDVLGDNFVSDKRIPLFSITGSTAVGQRLAGIIGSRLGRSILELGGNNAVIIAPSANLEMAIKSVVFGAVGTAGQRCTSTRRLIVHESIYDSVLEKLSTAYKSVAGKIGNPLNADTLVGPLISENAVKGFLAAIEKVKEAGGKVVFGGTSYNCENREYCHYVVPTLVEAENHWAIVQEETFAPILYVMRYNTIEEAIALNNGVPQGLSSSIFTQNISEAELFLSEAGSDCGIANVNIGTSGAEIGGAFGGEKDTGGGREAGSDSWKYYMRRQTNTINYGNELPLAQGIQFGF
jgi:aldehyde dehydrogenase (NAD+)